MTDSNYSEHARRDDLLMQNVTTVMAAQTETIKVLTLAVDALREKVHGMETTMAETRAIAQGRVENIEGRVSRLERVNQVVVGAVVSIIAALVVFLFQNVLRTGIGP